MHNEFGNIHQSLNRISSSYQTILSRWLLLRKNVQVDLHFDVHNAIRTR